MKDTTYFGASDADANFFIRAVIARFGRIIGDSGNPVTLTSAASNYVVPGAGVVVADGGVSVPVWIGVNCGRIFFIVRLAEKPDRCRELFEFAFGGAAKVGWSFYYQPTDSSEETSVWGTVETNALFVNGGHDTIQGAALTRDGVFWANDIGLMMQSAMRTIQRQNVALSTIMPEPI